MARALSSDPAWLHAMSEQRLTLEDGCASIMHHDLVPDAMKLLEPAVATQNEGDVLTAAKDSLFTASPISASLERVFKLRELCIESE